MNAHYTGCYNSRFANAVINHSLLNTDLSLFHKLILIVMRLYLIFKLREMQLSLRKEILLERRLDQLRVHLIIR